jgi:hypothetical protein
LDLWAWLDLQQQLDLWCRGRRLVLTTKLSSAKATAPIRVRRQQQTRGSGPNATSTGGVTRRADRPLVATWRAGHRNCKDVAFTSTTSPLVAAGCTRTAGRYQQPEVEITPKPKRVACIAAPSRDPATPDWPCRSLHQLGSAPTVVLGEVTPFLSCKRMGCPCFGPFSAGPVHRRCPPAGHGQFPEERVGSSAGHHQVDFGEGGGLPSSRSRATPSRAAMSKRSPVPDC